MAKQLRGDERLLKALKESASEPAWELHVALAELDYPIKDEASLQRAMKDKPQDLAGLIEECFKARGFPVQSAGDAFAVAARVLPARANLVPLHHLPDHTSIDAPIDVPTASPVNQDPLWWMPWYQRHAIEHLLRWIACRQRCDEEYSACMAEASGPIAEFRCEVARTLCKTRC